ncbi:MAG: autotransporter outer membrane beta-barrel domain-containing protein [Akkermansia sp.]|nr:autotransporter outer membrane beta-barrel domain-containing protein [Akkermansia sp.]
MKLHLNLTLRRALMAAMAVVSLQTTQAELTTEPNNLHTYLYGTGELTPDLWNSIWNATPKPSTLTIGNYLGAADATLSSSTYNNGKDIYIGGVGYDSNQEVANDGKLSTITGTVLNVNHLSLGNSLVGGTGTLAMNGGTVNVTSSLYVGVNRGCGAIETTNGAVIKVGTNKTGAVFTMSHRNISGLEDTVTLSGSSITVGAAGGVRDYTSIGHSAGTATLNLEAGSTAHFYDQLLVGEMGGSNGTINVGKKDTATSKSTLTLASTTVLGYESGAHGTINIYDGTVNVGAKSKDDILVIGHKGSGKVNIEGGTLDAGTGTILLGAELGANPEDAESTPDLHLEGGKAIAQNLIIGGAGRSSVKVETDAILEVHDIVIDGTDTSWSLLTLASGAQVGIQGTDGTRRIDNLFIGGDDRNGHLDNNTTLTVGNTIIGRNGMAEIKKGGSLTTDYLLIQSITDPYKGLTIEGKTTVNGAFVTTAGSKVNVLSGGTLTTSGGTTPTADGGTQNTIVAGTLTIENGGVWEASGDHSLYGTISNSGRADIASATAFSSATITNNTGGTLTIGTLVNSGTISNAGATTENGEEIKPAGTIDVTSSLTNYGTISNGGTWTTAALTNLGTISNTGTWNAKGETTSTVGTIINYNTLNVSGELTTNTLTNTLTDTPGTTGTTTVAAGGTWNIAGQTYQDTITNNGSITIQGAGRVDAGELLTEGNSTLTIVVDKTTTSTGAGQAVITLDKATEQPVTVSIDTANASALVGKKVDFLMEDKDGNLTGLDQTADFILKGNSTAEIDWANNRITAEIDGADMQISFTQSTGSGNGLTTGMKFDTVTAAETYEVETPETTDNVDITLEVVTETVEATAQTETLDEQKTTMDEEASTVLTKGDVVQKTEINQGYDDDGKTEKRTNIIIGKNVQSDNSQGSTSVQTVVANQVTTVTKTDNQGTTKDTKKETVGTGGLALVFDGNTTHKGEASKGKDEAHMGFEEGTSGTVTTKDEQDNDVQNVLAKVDVVKINEGATVKLEDLNMHSTHSIEAKNATIILDGADVHIGGSVDPTMFETVTVTVYDENHKAVLGADGKPLTKEVQVESKHHVSVNSDLDGSTIELKNGATLDFKVVDGDEHHTQHLGSATLENTTVMLTESTLGGKKTEVGGDYEYMEIQLTGDKSHLKGTGHVQKVNMKGGNLSVGNSPGVLNVTDSKFDRTNVNFYFITNSDAWNFNGTTTDTTKGSGAISQLNINESVTLTNVPVNILFEHLVEGTVDTYTQSTGAQIAALAAQFKEGAEIQLITGLENLTPDSTYTSVSGLPELEDGLFWDTSTLFKDGIIRIYGEILEEPCRIANSLVSAGETVLNFGRLAEAQAALREAGTTRTWGSAIAMFDSIDSGSSTNGYDYNTWGAAVGVDHAFTKNTVVGVAFGCTWGENEAKEGNGYFDGGSIDQEARMIGIYGVHKFQTKGLMNDVKLNAFAAYGMFENDSTRTALKTGNKAKAEWDSDAWVLSASLSRDITTDTGVVFIPYVGVEYTTAGMDDFTEQGRKTADYSADEDYSKLSVKVGVGVSKTYGSFTPYANVAFISDVARNAAEVTAVGRDTVTGKSALPGRNGFEIGVGATWQLTENLDVNAGYSAEIRDKATEHNARVGIGYTF